MDRLSAPRLLPRSSIPLNWLLNAASRSILRLLGVREASHQDILTDVEIEGLVEVSAEHGKMEESQAEYIHNLFRFGELEVADVMVHRTNMHSVNVAEPPEKIIDDILASPYTRVPVWENEPENIVGIVHAKDLLRAVKAAGGDMSQDRHPRDRHQAVVRPRHDAASPTSSMPSSSARRISRWSSTSTARCRAW